MIGDNVSRSKIEIKSELQEGSAFNTKIFFDGNQIKGVRSFCLKADIDTGYPILTIDINAFDLCLETPLTKVDQIGMGEIKSIEFKNGMKVEARD
jgi:hypothetical protein